MPGRCVHGLPHLFFVANDQWQPICFIEKLDQLDRGSTHMTAQQNLVLHQLFLWRCFVEIKATAVSLIHSHRRRASSSPMASIFFFFFFFFLAILYIDAERVNLYAAAACVCGQQIIRHRILWIRAACETFLRLSHQFSLSLSSRSISTIINFAAKDFHRQLCGAKKSIATTQSTNQFAVTTAQKEKEKKKTSFLSDCRCEIGSQQKRQYVTMSIHPLKSDE